MITPDMLLEAQQYAKGTVKRVLGTFEQDLEDVLQNAAVKVIRKGVTFRGDCQFRVWFCRVAINEALMHRRSRRRQFISIDDDTEAPLMLRSDAPNPEQQAAAWEMWDLVQREVSGMSGTLRAEAQCMIRGDGPGTDNARKARRFRVRHKLLACCATQRVPG